MYFFAHVLFESSLLTFLLTDYFDDVWKACGITDPKIQLALQALEPALGIFTGMLGSWTVSYFNRKTMAGKLFCPSSTSNANGLHFNERCGHVCDRRNI